MIKDILNEHKPLLILTGLIIIWGLGFQFFMDLKAEQIFYFYEYKKLFYSFFIIPIAYSAITFFSSFITYRSFEISKNKVFSILHFQNWLRLFLCCACLYITMITFSGVKSLIPIIVPFQYDPLLSVVDRFIHFGRYPYEYFGDLIYSSKFVWAMDRLYYYWFYVMLIYIIWVFILPRDKLGRMSYITSFLSCWIVLGNMVAIALSSTGPIFWNEFYLCNNNPYDFIQWSKSSVGDESLFRRDKIYRYLMRLHYDEKILDLASISAMPSVHVAVSALMFFHSWKYKRILSIFMFIYLLIIMMASIVLGWHYGVDGYVAIIGAYLIWKVSHRCFCNREMQSSV